MKSILRYSRISPKKANLIAGMVRQMDARKAMDTLKFTNKKGADILYKVVASAVANAKNNFKQKEEHLLVEEIIVTKGPTLKRHVPVSRGRAHPILKRTSHITVKLGLNTKHALTKTKEVKKEEAAPAEEAKAEEPKAKKTITKKATTTKKPATTGGKKTKSTTNK